MTAVLVALTVVAVEPALATALQTSKVQRRIKEGILLPATMPSKEDKASKQAGNKALDAQVARKPGDPRPIIKAVEDIHDFGTVWVGPMLKHSFKIKNEGDAILEIQRVKPSCGCTIAGPYPKKIKPGETGEFPFSISSLKLRSKFEKAITITSNDPSRPSIRLRLRGEVKRYVDVVPTAANFGKLYGGEPKERVIKLTNNTDKPLTLELGPPIDGNFEVKLLPKTPGQTYELVVKATPPYKPGVFHKRIVLNTNNEKQKSLVVDVRGSVPQRLDVSPTVLTLGGRGRINNTGRKLTRVIRFTNYGEAPTKLLGATADDPDIKVNVTARSEGKAYTVQVQFPKGYTLPEEGRKITLKTDDGEKPSIVVPIRSFGARTARKTKTNLRPAQQMLGRKAPVFSLKTTKGKPLTNADPQGRIQVLDFFAPNCAFCKRQIPRLEKIRARYEGKPVRFVAVSQTMRNRKFTDDKVLAKIAELGFHGELAINGENTVGQLFKAISYPTMVVLGKTGKVEAVNVGNLADLEKRLTTQLDALIAGKPIPKIETVAARTPRKTPKVQPPTRKSAGSFIGKPAPTFSIKTFDGKVVNNADFAKHPATVLNFVAGNCGFCARQIPRTEKIRQTYQSKGVRFVNVVMTMRTPFTKEQVVKKMDSLRSHLEVAHDVRNEIGSKFGAQSFPTMVIVGRSGKIEAVNTGNVSDLEKRLSTQLDALIAGKPVPKLAAAPPTRAKRVAKKAAPSQASARRKRADALLGKPAPQFSIQTFEGKTVKTADFANHPATVLNFVAGNCGFCAKQIPRLEKLRAGFQKKGVRFVNVVQTMHKPFTKAQVIQKMTTLGSHMEVAHDLKNEIGQKFYANGFPTMVIVGKSGKVEAVNVGNIADLENRVSGQLNALIEGKPVPKVTSARPTARKRPAEGMVGKPAPPFALKTMEGKLVSNADLKNHPATVLMFVAPNCGFCKRALPKVEKVRQAYEAKGIRFVNVVQKMRQDFTNDAISEVFNKVGSKLEITTGDFGPNQLGKTFKATSYPTMFVLDRNGKIANVNVGAKANLDTLLRNQLDALIKG